VSAPVDVVVVGGGLVGAAVAYELSGEGLHTVLIDRHDPGRATDAGAGILSPETIVTDNEAWFRLAMASAEHYRRLIPELAELAAPDTGYAQCGLLRLAFREWDDELFAATRPQILTQSGGAVRDVDAADAHAMFPPLGPVRAALYNPLAARIDGRRATAALLHGARRRGLTEIDASVTGIQRVGGTVSGVEAGSDRIACGALVICGGAWTPPLGAQLGVELPIVPVRGQIIHLRLDGADSGDWPILQPVLSHYVVSWPEGRIVVGATVEPDAGFDAHPTAAGMRQLLSELLHLAGGLGDAAFVEVRTGLRPVSADDAPVLGRVAGTDNAYVATGHGANGLLLGPYSARLVAESVLGREPSMDLRPFTPDRFTRV
jgi:D-amino-acid dehydrogenase